MSEQEEKDLNLVKTLLSKMTDRELDCPYKSASIVNDVEQPLILSSNEDFSVHYLNMAGGVTMGFPTKMIPYIIEALNKMYNKNGLDHFKGSSVKFNDNHAEVTKDLNIRYFELDDVFNDMMDSGEIKCDNGSCGCGDPDCDSKENDEEDTDDSNSGISKKMKEIQNKLKNGDIDASAIDPHSKIKIIDKLLDARKEMQEHVANIESNSGKMSIEEQQEMKRKVEDKMAIHLNEVESLLLGKKAEFSSKIDINHITNIFKKYGAEAAKEELMRVPEEERDLILQQLVKNISNQ